MENNRNDQNQKADKSTLKQNPGSKSGVHPEDSRRQDTQQQPTNSGDIRKDPMHKTDQSGGQSNPGDQTPESFNPKHQTPEHQNNQKSNMGQVTNKDSEQSGSLDSQKQDNTTPSGNDNPYTHKQQKNQVDGSVMVEDEDQSEAIISDDIETPSQEDTNPNVDQVKP